MEKLQQTLFFLFHFACLLSVRNEKSFFNKSNDNLMVWLNPGVSAEDDDSFSTFENEQDLLHIVNQSSTEFRKFLVITPSFNELSLTGENISSGLMLPIAIAKFAKKTAAMKRKIETWIFPDSYYMNSSDSRILTSLSKVVDVANQANAISEGSVTKILVYLPPPGELKTKEFFYLRYLQSIRNLTKQSNYSVGIVLPIQSCIENDHIWDSPILQNYPEASRLYGKPLASFDFVSTYVFMVNPKGNELPSMNAPQVIRLFENCKRMVSNSAMAMKKQVAFLTPSPKRLGVDGYVDYVITLNFYREMDTWSGQSNTTVILMKAFDSTKVWTPFDFSLPALKTGGWWKLVENGSYEEPSQYVFQDLQAIVKESATNENSYSRVIKKESDWNRNKTVVSFDPRVATDDTALIFKGSSKYSGSGLTHILNWSAKEFSKIYISGTGNDDTSVEVISLHVANLNKNATRNEMQIWIGVNIVEDVATSWRNLDKAYQSAEKANAVFGGSVTGIFLIHYHSVDNQHILNVFAQILQHARKLKKDTIDLGVSFELRNCLHHPKSALGFDEWAPNILSNVKFIAFNPSRIPHLIWNAPETEYFKRDTSMFKRCKRKIGKRYPEGPQVVFRSRFSSMATTDTRNDLTLEQVHYWDLVSDWANRKNITVWMDEAFDTPYKSNKDERFQGWWTLIQNHSYGSVQEYQFVAKRTIALIIQESSISKDGDTSWDKFRFYSLLAGAATVFILICLLLAWARRKFLIWRRLGHEEYELEETKTIFLNGADEMFSWMVGAYDKSKWEVKEADFDITDLELGSGEFGKVYKANLRRRGGVQAEAAVKMCKSENSIVGLRGILSDIRILSYVGAHENVVGFYGAHTENLNRGVAYAFVEFCHLGSLYSCLRNYQVGDKENAVDEDCRKEMKRWCGEILCGMEFLASRQVVHADLATRNVLVSESRTAKISDFGLSRKLYSSGIYWKKHADALPWRWLAPESLRSLKFTEKTDVWSFGVTMWEIFSFAELPYSVYKTPWVGNTVFVDELEKGVRLERPLYADEIIYGIMAKCWHLVDESRPSFASLKRDCSFYNI